MRSPLRWLAIGVFVLSSTLNYLDRQLLAALAPTLKAEFQLNNTEYGQIVSASFLIYALVAPFAGWFVDRLGLNLGASIAVLVWSMAGSATALFRSVGGLAACRVVLHAAEAAGIPSTGKANAIYLEPRELALGTAMNQVGISLGLTLAPLVAAAMAPRYGWRSAFALCGALGFVWIPLWWFTSRKAPAASPAAPPAALAGSPWSNRRLWLLAAANALVMTTYALWTTWTTLYFVVERHLTEQQANQQFAWIPPVFAVAGGFCGGWLAYRLIRGGVEVRAARLRISWAGAVVILTTAAVPFMPTPGLAAALISLSFFSTLAISANVYALPIDLFGQRHAAFGVAILTSAYGLMQTAISPIVGSLVDRSGFAPVFGVVAVLPLAGVCVLRWALK